MRRWGRSSAGRASGSQSGGRGFNPLRLHQPNFEILARSFRNHDNSFLAFKGKIFMRELKIYTDGSWLGNPGAGGYAAILIDDGGKVEEICGGESYTTNNRMELTAAIVALKKISQDDVAEIFTDSTYLRNAFTQNWLANWKRRGWRLSDGKSVKNQDLWRELDELISMRNVKFNWVRGHAGDSLNERCDKLARDTAKKFQ